VGGLELRKPDAGSETETRTKNIDAELVQYYEEILESWCDDIESFLNSKQSNVDNADAGPMTELEWWKQRMQHLSNVIEQLKAKEMKSVVTVLSSWSKSQQHDSSNRQRLFALLRRWKHVEIVITESSNEAKDNVKYLFTLEKFLEPLYKGSPSSVIDTLPALMNSIKMIHTIARYYNTNERMTNLFVKITSQMIVCCRKHILGGQLDKDSSTLWDTDAKSLCDKLDICLKLNDSYQEHYRLTKDKLLTMPKGKQFDFSESAIFGKLEMFCRRITKLMDMFSTIQQFRTLASHKLEGMEDLLSTFDELASQFRGKGHDLLDYNNGKFDRDYVEFNVGIANLERSLQSFINDSFESITSITHSLNLLKKFQTILQRESLRNDLDNKFTLIFQTYVFFFFFFSLFLCIYVYIYISTHTHTHTRTTGTVWNFNKYKLCMRSTNTTLQFQEIFLLWLETSCGPDIS
jgi:dynein heavy chain, axonemal